MDTLEKQFQEGVDFDDIPGAIAVARDASGKFIYNKAVGNRTLLDGTKKPLQTSDILALYSATKLFTSVAALQCVEKGLLTLDEDISRVIPHFKDVQVLTAFVDEKPQYEDKKKPITLRQLMTHSAGTPYDLMDPVLGKWRAQSAPDLMWDPKLEKRFSTPLAFQPGQKFGYGTGLDWAGRAVEIVTKQTLEEYFKEHIFAPVGIKNMSFFPMKDATLRELMVDLNPDDPNGVGLAPMGGVPSQTTVADCFGGQGLYGPAEEYIKVPYSLLVNDGKLLKPATADMLFEPQWEAPAHQYVNSEISDTLAATPASVSLPKEVERDYGLGGCLVQEDLPGWYQKGTIAWGGAFNWGWFIDRRAGLCGIGGAQPYMRDAPATRGPDYVFKPHREGAVTWEQNVDHYLRLFRKGIYEVYRNQAGKA